MIRLLLLLSSALLACTPTPPPDTVGATTAVPATVAAADTQDVRMTGTVRVVGSAPMNVQVVIHPEGEQSTRIAGPLTEEIRRLSGAVAEVTGSMENGVLRATDYRVVSVDGEPVVTGVVERAPAGGLQLRQPNGTVVELSGGADHLEVGQKVWVQGPTSVRVQTFGVIQP